MKDSTYSAFVSAASQQSRVKWPVSAKCDIAAPAARVWQAIAAPANLENCHPFCDRNPVHAWPGPESRDEVHYLSGWVYERRFRNWLEGEGYDLDIASRGEVIASVSWRVHPVDDCSCTLEITVCPYALQHLPVVIRWLPHLIRLRPRLKSYLESVVRGVEWFVTRNEAVPRDNFGKHPWFSAPGNAHA